MVTSVRLVLIPLHYACCQSAVVMAHRDTPNGVQWQLQGHSLHCKGALHQPIRRAAVAYFIFKRTPDCPHPMAVCGCCRIDFECNKGGGQETELVAACKRIFNGSSGRGVYMLLRLLLPILPDPLLQVTCPVHRPTQC
jgi:hypothetical protein